MPLWAAVLLLLVATACDDRPHVPSDAELSIRLRWVKAYPRERRQHVETGLLWTLSYLGAQLPEGASIARWDNDVVTLDLLQAQVIEAAQPAWRKLLAVLKASEEYRTRGAIDAGRFIALTLGSPHHYYSLTDASPSYERFRSRYAFEPRRAAVLQSAIARGHRLIEIGRAARYADIAFVAFEGNGSLRDATFVPQDIETIDMMANGQPRFALYELGGALKAAATSSLTAAGKPAKCLWCHESKLMQTIGPPANVAGYHSTSEFDAVIAARRKMIEHYRGTLDSSLNFARQQDHTFAELLYLSFMEPSVQRLAGEWGISIDEARGRVRDHPTHAHPEFAFLGDQLYRRSDIDALGPILPLPVPSDVREVSAYEPNYLR